MIATPYVIQSLEPRVLLSFSLDDPSFNPLNTSFTGRNAERVIALPSGKLLVASSNGNQVRVSRLAVDGGSLDSGFALGGSFTFAVPNVVVGDMVVLGDGRIRLLSSSYSSISATQHRPGFVIGLTAQGELDPDFGVGGISTISLSTATPVLRGLAVDALGRLLVVGGATTQYGLGYPPVDSMIFRLQADGEIDPAFGGGIQVFNFGDFDVFQDVIVDSANNAIVFQTVDFTLLNSNLARFTDLGARDTTFGGTAFGLVQFVTNAGDMQTDAAGRIYVSIDLRVNDGISVVRFNPSTGMRDLLPGGSPYFARTGVWSTNAQQLPMAVTPAGKVLIGTKSGGNYKIWGFDVSGFPDTSFGGGGTAEFGMGLANGGFAVGTMAWQGDALLISAGSYDQSKMTVKRVLPNDTTRVYGGVEGVVFSDSNANGVQDAGEAPKAYMRIYEDANNDGFLDAGERVYQTAADGFYRLTNLVPGNAVIRVDTTYYTVVTPAGGSYQLSISAGELLAGRAFALQEPTITDGLVFYDSNLNGEYDTGESGIYNRTVYIDQNGNGSLDPDELYSTTDASGKFRFVGLTDNQTYTFRQVLPSGILQSHPLRDAAAIYTATSSQQTEFVRFGTYNPAQMSPAAFGGLWQFSNFFGVDVIFSENVAASVNASDFQLNRLFLRPAFNVAPLTEIEIIATSPKTVARVFLPYSLLFEQEDAYELVIPNLASVTDSFGVPLMAMRRSIFCIIPGDATFDNFVNLDDFSRLANGFGKPGAMADGDFNFDQFVALDDFSILAGNFGRTVGGVARLASISQGYNSSPGLNPPPVTTRVEPRQDRFSASLITTLLQDSEEQRILA